MLGKALFDRQIVAAHLVAPLYNSETKSWGRSFTHTISTQLPTARLGGCHEKPCKTHTLHCDHELLR